MELREFTSNQEITDFIMSFDGELTTKFNKVYSGDKLVAIYHKIA